MGKITKFEKGGVEYEAVQGTAGVWRRGKATPKKGNDLGPSIAGQRISKVRSMTKAELYAEGWDSAHTIPVVLELENGTLLYASQDEEGNGPGALFGTNGDKHFLAFPS